MRKSRCMRDGRGAHPRGPGLRRPQRQRRDGPHTVAGSAPSATQSGSQGKYRGIGHPIGLAGQVQRDRQPHGRSQVAGGNESAEVEVDGMDLVLMRGDRIARNEVYFDRAGSRATRCTSIEPDRAQRGVLRSSRPRRQQIGRKANARGQEPGDVLRAATGSRLLLRGGSVRRFREFFRAQGADGLKETSGLREGIGPRPPRPVSTCWLDRSAIVEEALAGYWRAQSEPS